MLPQSLPQWPGPRVPAAGEVAGPRGEWEDGDQPLLVIPLERRGGELGALEDWSPVS